MKSSDSNLVPPDDVERTFAGPPPGAPLSSMAKNHCSMASILRQIKAESLLFSTGARRVARGAYDHTNALNDPFLCNTR
jgi:hypothetical protein